MELVSNLVRGLSKKNMTSKVWGAKIVSVRAGGWCGGMKHLLISFPMFLLVKYSFKGH